MVQKLRMGKPSARMVGIFVSNNLDPDWMSLFPTVLLFVFLWSFTRFYQPIFLAIGQGLLYIVSGQFRFISRSGWAGDEHQNMFRLVDVSVVIVLCLPLHCRDQNGDVCNGGPPDLFKSVISTLDTISWIQGATTAGINQCCQKTPTAIQQLTPIFRVLRFVITRTTLWTTYFVHPMVPNHLSGHLEMKNELRFTSMEARWTRIGISLPLLLLRPESLYSLFAGSWDFFFKNKIFHDFQPNFEMKSSWGQGRKIDLTEKLLNFIGLWSSSSALSSGTPRAKRPATQTLTAVRSGQCLLLGRCLVFRIVYMFRCLVFCFQFFFCFFLCKSVVFRNSSLTGWSPLLNVWFPGGRGSRWTSGTRAKSSVLLLCFGSVLEEASHR